MCGIMGMVLNKRERDQQELETLRLRFSRLLSATQVRGYDAAGAFVVNESGLRYHKAQGAASGLVRTPMWWGLMDTIGSETLGAIGHTRFATTGCPSCNDNNHPILINNLIGVHNGVLYNDDDIREIFPYDQEVDSAAIFSALDGRSDGVLNADVIGDTLPMLMGDMAIAVADGRDTNKLFIARDTNRPLYLLEDKDALWIASTPEILSVGLKVNGWRDSESLDANSVMTFDGGRDNKVVSKW